jgi:hypothetical protein
MWRRAPAGCRNVRSANALAADAGSGGGAVSWDCIAAPNYRAPSGKQPTPLKLGIETRNAEQATFVAHNVAPQLIVGIPDLLHRATALPAYLRAIAPHDVVPEGAGAGGQASSP